MRYDIFIIDDEITFNNFNEVAQNSIKNAKVTFFSQIEDLINEIEFTDILVLNIDSINLFNKIRNLLRSDVYTLFIINDNSDLAKIPNSKGYDILYNPLDFDKLIYKITNFTKNIKKEQNANMALSIADKAYVLESGRIALAGTAQELASSEAVRKAYLGG